MREPVQDLAFREEMALLALDLLLQVSPFPVLHHDAELLLLGLVDLTALHDVRVITNFEDLHFPQKQADLRLVEEFHVYLLDHIIYLRPLRFAQENLALRPFPDKPDLMVHLIVAGGNLLHLGLGRVVGLAELAAMLA